MVYSCGVLTNNGNYKGFGDSKFVPNFEQSQFEKLVLLTQAYKREPKVIESLWSRIKDAVYKLEERDKSLGLSDKVCIFSIDNNLEH